MRMWDAQPDRAPGVGAYPEPGAAAKEGATTVSGFQNRAIRKYATMKASPSVVSTPVSQSSAERTYNRIGTIASVTRPQAANQARTNLLGSLKSLAGDVRGVLV